MGGKWSTRRTVAVLFQAFVLFSLAAFLLINGELWGLVALALGVLQVVAWVVAFNPG